MTRIKMIKRIAGRRCELLYSVAVLSSGGIDTPIILAREDENGDRHLVNEPGLSKCIEDSSSLLDDEISAQVIQIGDYSVRLAIVACKRYPNIWEERIPAPRVIIQALRKQEAPNIVRSSTINELRSLVPDLRIETVVSACKHLGTAKAADYRYICHAQTEWQGWAESIGAIYLVKTKNASDPYVLLVNKVFGSNDSGCEYWYKYHDSGSIEECRLSNTWE